MTGAVHVTKVDRSAETGTLMVCTYGVTLGPFQVHATATREAIQHRRTHEQAREHRAAGN